jgi:GDPmannose 4,6-dehydratase
MGIRREWGWAPEYVEARWKIVQRSAGDDCVIATGESHALEEFVDLAFKYFNLDWREHTDISPALLRPTDLAEGLGDAAKARALLNWSPTYELRDIVTAMSEAEMSGLLIA